MEDTAAGSEYLAVIDDIGEPDYLAVIDNNGEPDFLAVIDVAAEPDYLAVIDDTGEPDFLAVIGIAAEPGYLAVMDDARKPAYDAAVTDDTDAQILRQDNTYSELDETQVYDDIVDIAPPSNTDTQLQVVEAQTKSRYACKIPRLILAAIVSLGITVVILTILIAIAFLYLFGVPRLPGNSTEAINDNKLPALGRVTSAEYMYDFTVDQFVKTNELNLTFKYNVDIFSVSSNGHLLVGAFISAELHVYTTSGSHVTTLNSSDSEHFKDAAWTRGGNIVCITKKYVMVLSMSGKVLTRFDEALPPVYLSVSQDGGIYVSGGSCVHESTDDGMTWSVKFSVASDSYIFLAIKVSSDQYNEIFFTVFLEPLSESRQLYVYTLNKTADNAVRGMILSSVTIPTRTILMKPLTFDGHSTIFAPADSVHVFMWSVDGTFNGHLQLLRHNSLDAVICLAVDGAKHTMYVGLSGAKVGVFTLTYESA